MKPIVACTNALNRRDGAAMLATVVGLMVILSVYTAGVFAYVGAQRRAVANQVDIEQAFTVAEAGVERAAAYIELHHGIVAAAVCTNGSVNYDASTQSNQYQAVIVPISGYEFKISSTGTVYRTTWTGNPMSVSRVIAVNRVWLPSWSKYAMWSHDNNQISYVQGEVISGAVHADNEIYFSGNPGPIFHGPVTSATNTWYADSTKKGSLSHVTFDQGFKTNASGGTLADVPFDDLETLAGTASNGIVIPADTYIDFSGTNLDISTNFISTIHTSSVSSSYSHGKTVYTTNWYDTTLTNWYQVTPTNTPQLIYAQGDVYVAGTNGGRATIVADGDIHITNTLTYTSGTNSTFNEALGLISKSNIWVDTSCPTNMKIFAHIMATGEGGGFGAVSYNARKTGALTMFGGLVQAKRFAVGQGTNGFKKFYTYDTRFTTNPPPYYPVQSEIINYERWEEHAP